MEFTELIDLAAERLGGAALLANDEFFAPKENLLKPSAPVFREGEYTERGKWMDGWETRRRRTPGHDWCIIRLGLPGLVRAVLVDTAHFKGNYPEQCSIDACAVAGVPDPLELAGNAALWSELLPRSDLRGDAQNLFAVAAPSLQARRPEAAGPSDAIAAAAGERVTHLRLNIYPDGGVARLRIYGEAVPDWSAWPANAEIDLAAAENGGLVVACSDMFFGDRHNLIMPGRATSMADGWETKRRRGPGHDWLVVRLGAPGAIHRVEVDTDHYKGNAPESCSLEGCKLDADESLERAAWTELLPRVTLRPHSRHRFERELQRTGTITHARFNIFPDGGVARLRLFGMLAARAG